MKAKTRSTYRYHVDHYVVPRVGGIRLQDLRPRDLTELYATLRTTGGRGGRELGWTSVKAIHRTLSSALGWAHRAEILMGNPAERATLPPKPRPVTREAREAEDSQVFTPDQLRNLLDHASHHRLGALIHLAAFSGARRGELLHLRWEDIDFAHGELHIAGSRGLAGGKVVEDNPKSGRRRTISVDPGTLAVLRSHRAHQAEDRLKAGELWLEQGDYVFRTGRGDPIHPDTPSSLMPKLCRAAGVQRLRFHDLRHTHATILLSAGVPVHEVADDWATPTPRSPFGYMPRFSASDHRASGIPLPAPSAQPSERWSTGSSPAMASPGGMTGAVRNVRHDTAGSARPPR